MTRRSSIRASDADREDVAQRLTQAAAEGRLLVHELEERLATALQARTYGELEAVVADLPRVSASTPTRARRSTSLLGSHPAAGLILASVALLMIVVVAVALATVLAFGGIWLILALVFLARRGPWPGAGYGGRRRGSRGFYRRGWI